METMERLLFVMETLPKVEIMVKILKDVTCELYHTQLMTHANTVGRSTGLNRSIEDDWLKKLSNSNQISGDKSLANITTLLNLYLDNTIIRQDSILNNISKQQQRIDSMVSINKS